jgi:hypothetical protein
MTPVELYDATRGIWKVGKQRREQADYAFAVYEGIVREVYRIKTWLPAGSTFSTRDPRGVKRRGRWEFVRDSRARTGTQALHRHLGRRLVSTSGANPDYSRYINIP